MSAKGDVVDWFSDLDNGSEFAFGSGPVTAKSYVDAADINDRVEIKGRVIIKDPDTNAETDVTEFIKTINERMLILQPNFEAMDEYPALKDAYDQYKMLEKLLMKNNKKGK